uniref:Protein kinase domain-containing protein n=1 Tax=Daucus carota subsp. sativus TaxID=79200 RepID=A0A164UKL5_DAUCS
MGTLIFAVSALLQAALFSICSLALSQDGVTLLDLKISLNDSKSFLSDWNDGDETPCQWTGISCNADDQTVSSINLPYMQLGGFISPIIGKLRRLERLTAYMVLFQRKSPIVLNSEPYWLTIFFISTIRDLSSNSITGSIPASLGRLKRLHYMNLSANFFSGEIPDVGVLSKFRNNSFIGNLDLCGRQINKPCKTSLGFPAVLPHAESDEVAVPTKKSSHYVKGALIGVMSTLTIALLVLIVFLWVWFRSKKERATKRYKEVKKQSSMETGTKLKTFHGDLPYTSSEIIEKLECLTEEDVVGTGGFGTVYRMVMNDCATFAVKRIDRSREGCDEVFEMELEILGSVKHINLVNLRGYCRLPNAKLLIYDYLALGSLDDFLHEHWEDQSMNWNARLRVALGSARGLAYLHHDCYPRIIHRDIKSSNILLDENLEPHVSDFGLAKLLVDEDAHVTTVVAGTFGYMAPEYLQSGMATEKSDVYSFGVLLLELITGKRPTDPAFVKHGLNVVGWMNTLVRENRMAEMVDKRCKDTDLETVEAILEIAARCTDANPDERPQMQQVLQFLEQEVMSPCPSDFYDSHSDYA